MESPNSISRPALLMHYVIVPWLARSWLLKFYRAALLIEAISAGNISLAMSEGCRRFKARISPSPCDPFSLTLIFPGIPHSLPLSCFCLPLPVSLPVFSCCHPPTAPQESERTALTILPQSAVSPVSHYCIPQHGPADRPGSRNTGHQCHWLPAACVTSLPEVDGDVSSELPS